jgi:hypothetical protein
MAQNNGRRVGRRGFLAGATTVLAGGLVAGPAWAAPRPLDELGRRFQELRRRRTTQKPGVFDRDLDGFGGKLHEVMIELGKRLGSAGTTGTKVIAIMGEPDERKPERWVYLWRGRHDYLYFEMAKDRVVRSDWYMAGE